ncbi:MAG TPA: DUF4231 domain-containing protein [Macellibacteroides fermentans]|uniref:DUF4231 domain-containing protein n=1 Tax=Macellibacteroides fermentans TaxID=879969 RepID=UPI002C1CB6C7|nr:DUF4231 domain-containing protein [Macellibacteroides fermentans]
MIEIEFPSYYQAADRSSVKAQSYYVNIIRINLLSMIFASALSIYNYQLTNSKLIIYMISGLLLLLSLILTIVLKIKKYEDIWYQGRALAESCKTLTWRFISCSEYFEVNLSLLEAKERFVNRIKELSKEFSELSKIMDSRTLSLPIITHKMIELRCQNTIQRKKYYIINRIENQKKWYSNKAEYNVGKYNIWFLVIIFSQIISFISIVLLIKYPDYNWNFVGLFTTISTSSISWLQIKQHQELKQAYTTAAQELNHIVTLSESIKTDDELSKFVLDSENAISKEHTLWSAQKRK